MQSPADMTDKLWRVVVVAVVIVGCGRAAKDPRPGPKREEGKLSADELRRIQYLRDNTSIGVPHELNLADDEQYGYVMDTLRRFGRTADRSPRLFALVEEARKARSPGKPVLANLGDGAQLQGINYVPRFGSSGGTFTGNAFSTYPADQIPYNTNVLVSLIDMDQSKIIDQGQANVCGQTNIQVPVSGAPEAQHDDVEVNALFLVAPTKGAPLKAYNVVLEDQAAIADACQLSPNYNTGGTQQCQASGATTCVNTSPMPRPVKLCYGPRIQNDCDYGCQGSGYPPNIIFPIKGSVDLGQQPVLPLSGSLYIVMTDTTGGGCVLQATNTSNPLSSLITMDGTAASWDLAPATFPNQTCLRPNGMLFDYLFQLFLQTSSGYVGVTFTSDTSQSGLPDTVIVPQMNIVQGCLPAGVKIRMADKTEKAIETFQGYGDEKVLSKGGVARAVTATTWGEEEKPLISIRDDAGHALLLTQEHPVITGRGTVMAKDLRVGDSVFTDKGEAKLTEVGPRPSPKPVPIHNLRVGTDSDATAGDATFYANGILVGDQTMQLALMMEAARPRKLTAEELRAQLPAEWLQDCQTSIE